jgi:hypothetical protein
LGGLEDRIPLVSSIWKQEPRLIWSFWVAAALVAVGGAVPFLIGGSSSRVAGVFIPYAIAALAFVACALLNEQGRGLTSLLYLLAGLGIVYGLLTMFAVPLQLAVLGTCPVAPAPCPAGKQHALTLAENTGIGFAAGFGILALFIGFLGLVVVYRRATAPVRTPPVRTIPPVATTRPSPDAPAKLETMSENGSKPAEREPEQEPELPPHVEEELPELPPHESESPTN